MDLSDILTQDEAEFTMHTIEHLRSVPWAAPLVHEIAQRGDISRANKPLLFEARVAYALARAGVRVVEYEHRAGVGESTVDFRLGTQPEYLVEVVSIGRSAAVEAASSRNGIFFGTILTSPSALRTSEENKQSEEDEGLLAVQKIGQKVHDGKAPIKFPPPRPGRYHVVVVDMRGHLGGGDHMDWRQIAYGPEVVPPRYRKPWLDKNNQPTPFRGVWHPQNPMRFAATARERLHAILFVAEERYAEGALCEATLRECDLGGSVCEGAWLEYNPHLFVDEAQASAAFAGFPLRPVAPR